MKEKYACSSLQWHFVSTKNQIKEKSLGKEIYKFSIIIIKFVHPFYLEWGQNCEVISQIELEGQEP